MRGGRVDILKRPENIFTLFGLLFGLLFCFLTGPFQVPDEFVHYFRSYSLSEGNFVHEEGPGRLMEFHMGELLENRFTEQKVSRGLYGYSIPVSLMETAVRFHDLHNNPAQRVRMETIRELLKKPISPQKRIFFQSGSFLPLPYIPQAAGIFIGRLFRLSPLALLYCGRIANLLIFLLLLRSAITLTPLLKWVFCVLGLLPMTLFLAASVSYDAFTIGIAFSLIATLLSMAFAGGRLETKDWLLLFAVSLSVAFSKYIYIVLILAYFVIPVWKAGSRRRYLLFFILIAGLDLLGSATWFYALEWRKYAGATAPFSGQLAQTIGEPSAFGISLARTLYISGLQIVRHFFGVLGWLNLPLPFYLQIYSCLMLMLTALYDHRPEVNVGLRQKVVLALPPFMVLLLAAMAMYLTWNPVGTNYIEGLQGRYFIPVSPLVCALFYNRRIYLRDPSRFYGVMLPLYFTVSLTYSLWLTLDRYFLPLRP